jgi:hypothetical protein
MTGKSETILVVGTAVRCLADNCPAEWREDWRDWTGYIAGVHYEPRVGLNYSVCDQFPPQTNGDTTDGFRENQLEALTRQAQVSDEEEHRRFFEAVEEMRSEAEGAVMDPKKRDWLKLTVQLAERALHQPASKAGQVSDDAVVERWKGETYLDLNEQRNPGTDEFAKGFNEGIIKARDTIYAKLPQLLSATNSEAVSELLTEAKAHLGAGFGDHPNEAIRQSNVNRAWHLVTDALAKLGSRAP